MKQNGNVALVMLLVVILLVAVAGGAYWYFTNQKPSPVTNTVQVLPSSQAISSPTSQASSYSNPFTESSASSTPVNPFSEDAQSNDSYENPFNNL
jgi:hypothetical protein